VHPDKHPDTPQALRIPLRPNKEQAMNALSPDAIRAETITITGHGGDEIEAHRAMPLADGSRGGIVWIHHMPGYDRETKEFVRRLAVNGYHRRSAARRSPQPPRLGPHAGR
jgi:carboxymethylenebutenolidase